MRLRRTLAVAALAVIVTAGLSGCQNKVGLAASVGGHRISESDVGKYLTVKAVPFTVQGQSGSTTIVPKVYALQALIVNELFDKALADTKGGAPSKAELAAATNSVTSGASEAQQSAQYTKYGFAKNFAQLDIRGSALEGILAQRVGATTTAAPILAEIAKLKIPISVSGRYGAWDPKTLSISESGGVPSFVRFATSPAAPAATP